MRCLCLVLATLLSAWLLATPAQAQESVDECPYERDWKPTEAELQDIRRKHEKWFEDTGGLQRISVAGIANLCNANLIEADLYKAFLTSADLSQADLSLADLREAKLERADLHKAKLAGSKLDEADLRRADLRGVKPRTIS